MYKLDRHNHSHPDNEEIIYKHYVDNEEILFQLRKTLKVELIVREYFPTNNH